MLRSFEFAFDEGFVNHNLGCHIRQFGPLPGFDLLAIGSKLRCIRSTPTDMQSIKENAFECFAKTGVNTPVTCFRIDVVPRQTRFSAAVNASEGKV